MSLPPELEHAAFTRLRHGLASRYDVERELGRGGMATVYLARDLKHSRAVALKVLRPDLAAALGAERFHREIEVAARLQHPHILPLYDSGATDGLLYYVTPYVAGESLRARLTRERQLPVAEALRISGEVASALDYAHRQGVVHRDVKPENILLQDGQALVGDFGIARAIEAAGGVKLDELTETGLVLGTPHYMSPEQAGGERTLDGRSDVYSLGCVLFEMLAGEPPFTGPTAQAVLARHALAPVPSLRTVRQAVPHAVEHAVTTALAKAPADRFATAAAFAAALALPAAAAPEGDAIPPPATEVPAAAVRARQRQSNVRRITVGVAALAALVLAVFTVARTVGRSRRAPPATRRQITFSGAVQQAALSPDGQHVAYVVSDTHAMHVLVQDVAGGRPDTVDTGVCCLSLQWSQDGTRLLLTAFRRAVVVPRIGGLKRNIVVAGSLGLGLFGYWLPDGRRVSLHASADQRVLLVDLETEDTVAIPVRAGFWSITDGDWSPDGRLFAVMLTYKNPLRYTIGVVGLDGHTELAVEDSVLLTSPKWSSRGDAIYYIRDVLGSPAVRRVGVSSRSGRPRVAPVELHANLDARPIAVAFSPLSVTTDGQRAAYTRWSRTSNLWLVEASRPGLPPRTTALTSGTARRWSPAISPDGHWIAFAQAAGGTGELFKMPIEGGEATQVTSGARVWWESQIAWSPDGDRIAFLSIRGGLPQVWVANVADGRLRSFSHTRVSPYTGVITWAPAEQIAYLPMNRDNVKLLDPASEVQRDILRGNYATHGFVFDPRYLPDGKRLAFNWNRGPGDGGVWIFDLRDSSFTRLSESVRPRGLSADHRYIYQGFPTIERIDTWQKGARKPIVALPFNGDGECTPVGPRRPGAFVCLTTDVTSDVWMIENFDPSAK